VAVGFSLVTMDKDDVEDDFFFKYNVEDDVEVDVEDDVEEVPKALLEVASGNVRFTSSLYKVRGSCLADTNVASLLCALQTEYNINYRG
jgi:hypothetical protein